MKWSTAAVSGLVTAGFKPTFDTGVIDIFSGAAPADPNSAHTGTLLVRITKGSGAWVAGTSTNGLVVDNTNGVVSIHSGDTWSGVALADGTAGYALWKTNAADDNGAHTATIPRVQMTVSSGGGGECNLSHLDYTTGETVSINSVAITFKRGV